MTEEIIKFLKEKRTLSGISSKFNISKSKTKKILKKLKKQGKIKSLKEDDKYYYLLNKEYSLKKPKQINKKTVYIILLTIITFFSIFLRTYDLKNQFVDVDEPIYTASAMRETNQNWYKAITYNWEHPPLAKFLLGLPLTGFKHNITDILALKPMVYADLAKESVVSALQKAIPLSRFVNLIIFMILSLLVFYFAFKEGGWFQGMIAYSLICFSPILIEHSRTAFLDMSLTFFVFLMMFFYLFIYSRKRDLKNSIIFGLIIGFVLGTKAIQPVLFVLPLVIYEIIKRKKPVLIVLALLIGITLTVLLWSPDLILKTINFHMRERGVFKGTGLELFTNTLKFYLFKQPLILIIPFLFFLREIVPSITFSKKEIISEVDLDKNITILLLLLVSAFGVLFLTHMAGGRYDLPIIPFLCLISSRYLKKHKWLFVLFFLLFLSLCFSFPYFKSYSNSIGLTFMPVSTKESQLAEYINKNYQENTKILFSEPLHIYTFMDKFETHSIYEYDWGNKCNQFNPKNYDVYITRENIEINCKNLKDWVKEADITKKIDDILIINT